jgi:hypothetical protein
MIMVPVLVANAAFADWDAPVFSYVKQGLFLLAPLKLTVQ